MADEWSESLQATLNEALDRYFGLLRQELNERLTKEFTAVQEAAATRAAERLAKELATAQEAAAARAAAEAARAVRSTAESLRLAVCRIRSAASFTEVGAALLETAAAHCGRVALLVHKDEMLAGWRACGFTGEGFSDSWARFELPLREAPALAQAIETREAVVALALPEHLSPALIQLFGLTADQKAYLFPLSLRQGVAAILYADGVGSVNSVQAAALELLGAVAEASIEALFSRSAAPPPEPATGRLELSWARPTPRAAPSDWDALSPAEQEVHLRAQRFARVLVADLQLYRAQEILEGKQAFNLYGRLQDEIDKSREAYHRKFGSTSAASIDYFHLELLRTLAGGREELLGPGYPGPMVE
ncbi:MAG: hypothetical protein HY236_08260 [Acidobacteria bacterium]|nr:hypothetical protein [Acidobacteriota bacterium]